MIACIAPLIGMFLVTRRYALMADALSHIAFAGVAIGILTGIQRVFSALVTAVLGALAIEMLRRRQAANSEALLSLFLSGSLALAVILLSFSKGGSTNITTYLFGSITTVTPTDVTLIVLLGLVVALVVLVLYRQLFLLSLDEELAEASGVHASRINTILIVLTAVTVSLCMRIVGILLVGALMVIPVLAAIQITRSFFQTLMLSIVISIASVILGLYASYFYSLPSGATIVMICLGFFVMGLAWNQMRRS